MNRQELWVSTASFQRYMSGTLHSNETNFRIQAAYVDELVRGTKCDARALDNYHQNTGGRLPSRPTKWRSWYREEKRKKKNKKKLTTTLSNQLYDRFFNVDDANRYITREKSVNNWLSSSHFSRYQQSQHRFYEKSRARYYYQSSRMVMPTSYSFYIDHGWIFLRFFFFLMLCMSFFFYCLHYARVFGSQEVIWGTHIFFHIIYCVKRMNEKSLRVGWDFFFLLLTFINCILYLYFFFTLCIFFLRYKIFGDIRIDVFTAWSAC